MDKHKQKGARYCEQGIERDHCELNSNGIDDYELLDKDPEECKRRGMEAYGITESQLSVVTPYEIHSILIVNM